MQPTTDRLTAINAIPDAQNRAAALADYNKTTTPPPTVPTPTTPTPPAKGTPTGTINRSIYDSTSETAPTVKSADDIQRDMVQAAQGEINAINEYAGTLLAEQKGINEKNDRSTASISTLTGLAGSTEANIQQQKTTEVGQKANQAIQREAQLQVQTLLGKIRESALKEARDLRNEARLDETARLESRKARQEEAVTNLQNLASSGVTFEGLKKGDPEGFKYMSEQFGGEDAFRGAMILNTPQDQILDKKLEGGKYIITKQNPLTGKISIETLDTGLPPQYSKTIDAGNRILAIPDNWDGDPSNLVSISKGLTPKEAQDKEVPTVAITEGQAKDPFIQKMIKTAGGKPMTDNSIQKLSKGLTVLDQVGTLQTNIKDMKTGPIVGAFRGKNPWDTNAQVIKAQLNAIVPNLARGVYGEVGVLTDNDIKIYSQTLPNLSSTEDIRNAILGITVDLIGKSVKKTLEVNAANQKDVSGFVDIYTDMNSTRDSIFSQIPGYKPGGASASLRSPDGTQEVNLADLTPAQIEEAKSAGWK